MSKGHVRDDWLLPTLETLLSKESVGVLKTAAQDSYWETAVRRGFITDDEILTALASRFHMKIANLSLATPQAREHVPEPLARKYRIIPLTISDSALGDRHRRSTRSRLRANARVCHRTHGEDVPGRADENRRAAR